MLYINGRFLTQPLTGVNRFSYEITKALYKCGCDFVLVCPKQKIREEYDVTGFKIIHYGFGRSHVCELFSLPFFFLRKSQDILVSFSGLGPVAVRNKITTIHDVAHLENPRWYSLAYRMFYRLMEPLVIYTCKKVITVSEFSKSEIIKHYPRIKPDDIEVIYNACNEQWGYEEEADPVVSDYFLCVSSIDPRKNFPILLSAFKELPEVNLKIVGGMNAVFNKLELEVPKNAEFLGRVSDDELASLYRNAKAFIYPSLYEGFGLPPIEAAHFGCPVVLSDIPVLKEVCRDSAIYFNPYSPESIIEAVKKVNSFTDQQRDEMIAKAKNNIKRFTWDTSAKKLLKLLS
jgi:glycosyltransferase involved in cell wall biosynthesis